MYTLYPTVGSLYVEVLLKTLHLPLTYYVAPLHPDSKKTRLLNIQESAQFLPLCTSLPLGRHPIAIGTWTVPYGS